jgi:hypothetical protein
MDVRESDPLFSVETIVREIRQVNRAWKAAKHGIPDSPELATTLRDLKSQLQYRLLKDRKYQAYLKIDNLSDDFEEPVFGVHLSEPVDEGWYAEHLPVRVARELFGDEELSQICKED